MGNLSAADKRSKDPGKERPKIFFHPDIASTYALLISGASADQIRAAGGSVLWEQNSHPRGDIYRFANDIELRGFIEFAKKSKLLPQSIIILKPFAMNLSVEEEEGYWIISFGSTTLTIPSEIAEVRIEK